MLGRRVDRKGIDGTYLVSREHHSCNMICNFVSLCSTWSFLCLSCHIRVLSSKCAYTVALSWPYSQCFSITSSIVTVRYTISWSLSKEISAAFHWKYDFLLQYNSCYFINFVTRNFLFVFSYTDTSRLRRCSYVPEGQAKIGIECVYNIYIYIYIYIWSCARTQGSWFNPLNPWIISHLLFAGIIRSSPFSPR